MSPHSCNDKWQVRYLKRTLCSSLKLSLSLCCWFLFGILPSTFEPALHPLSLTSGSSALWDCLPSFSFSFSAPQPGNCFQKVIWINYKAGLFASLLSSITVLFWLLSNVWKLLFYIYKIIYKLVVYNSKFIFIAVL